MPGLPPTQVLWQLLTGGLLAGLELCPQFATGPPSLHKANPQVSSAPRHLPWDESNVSSRLYRNIQLTEGCPDVWPP